MTTMTVFSTMNGNRVLRNTFILLATTLVPTVLGVYFGAMLGIPEFMVASPWLSLLSFLAVSLVLLFAIFAAAPSFMSIILVYAFTAVIGLSLSGPITAVLGTTDGVATVALAFIGTMAVLLGCSIYAATTKRDFNTMHGFLFGSLLALIALGLANMFFHAGVLSILLAAASLVIFSLLLIYDVQRVIRGGETNCILATVAIYLDLANIFGDLLHLLSE